jgi:hypothetical protein
MKCPLCTTDAAYSGHDENSYGYHCDGGHVIDVLRDSSQKPSKTPTTLVFLINWDGDELYCLEYMGPLQRIYDVRFDTNDSLFHRVPVGLEGTGTEVADDNNPEHDYEIKR